MEDDERREMDIRHAVKVEVQLENLTDLFGKHENSDNERFEKITEKIDELTKTQTKIMSVGIAAFTIVSLLVNYFSKYF